MPPVRIPLFFLCLLLFSSCNEPATPQAAQSRSTTLVDDYIHLEYAVYFLPGHAPAQSTEKALTKFIVEKYPGLTVVPNVPKAPQGMYADLRWEKDVQRNYSPPNPNQMRYAAQGLNEDQKQALRRSRTALRLEFAHPKQNVWVALRNAEQITEWLARQTSGLIWDEQTREIFTVDAWHKKRLELWTAEIPDIRNEITIHQYPTGDYDREITLGMSKFGLPDAVVQEVPTSSAGSAGDLIDFFCQSITEKPSLPHSSDLKLNIHELKNQSLRNVLLKSLKHNARAEACVSVKPGKWEEGDPKNRLLELYAGRYPGPDLQSRQEAMLGSLWGFDDEAFDVEHTPDVLEASSQAREHLPELRRIFNAGLQPGEYIELKAPFTIPGGGREWMWVQVQSWKAGIIRGTLDNDPARIPDLKAGQIVGTREADVFDYIHRFPDKHSEGNTTEKLIEQHHLAKASPPEAAPVPSCDPE